MSTEALTQVEHEARREAAPVAAVGVLALVALALVSRAKGWTLLDDVGWWLWLVAAVPYAVLAVTLLAGLGRVRGFARRRRIVQALLGVVVACGLLEIGLLVGSLVVASDLGIGGPQLLHSAVTLWLANVIAFGLALWELDCGGPVRRATADARGTPDLQFPQDENPRLARPGWTPHLTDYLYVSGTNSIAFSPTDAMPLTWQAKGLMALESAVSVVALLLVAARAINILQS